MLYFLRMHHEVCQNRRTIFIKGREIKVFFTEKWALDTAGRLNIWPHKDCANMYKTSTSSSE